MMVFGDEVLSWKTWKQRYSKQIEHVAGYEEAFVDRVLTQLPEVTPNDVVPQYHFKDDNGKNRYIDFMIINKSKGYCLPIELDGTYKDVNHQRWKDFLVRQNSLITKFGVVLRFTNKQMLFESDKIIRKINDTLYIQSKNKMTDEYKQKERENLVSWYDEKLNNLEEKNKNTTDIRLQINELRSLILDMQSKNDTNNNLDTHQKSNNRNKGIAIGVLVLMLVIGGVFFISSSDNIYDINESTPTKIEPKNTTNFEPESSPVNTWKEVSDSEIKQVLSSASWMPNGAVSSKSASKYVGDYKTICGVISQISDFSKGTYLNFDEKFPKSTFSMVVWSNDKKNILNGKLSFEYFLHKKVCVSGKIAKYKTHIQTTVNSRTQLDVF
ncbi:MULTISPECIES: hypothetical protein [Vibrio]|nr:MULTISPECIES: hypothetical protein [Vibrio]MPW36439.1 hypothetical protein [Vibrio sp. B1Z05]